MLSQVAGWPCALRPVREAPSSGQPLPGLPHPGLLHRSLWAGEEQESHPVSITKTRRGATLLTDSILFEQPTQLPHAPQTTGLHPLLPKVPLYSFMSNWNILSLSQTSLPQEECFSKWVFPQANIPKTV